MGKGGEEPVAGCEAFFFRRGRGGDLDVPAGGFEVGTLFVRKVSFCFWFLVLFLWVLWGERFFFFTYSDEVE